MCVDDGIIRLADLGWKLHPTACGSRAAAFRGAIDAATDDPDQLAAWARQYPGCGWRVVTGPSRLFVLDVDRPGRTHAADGIATLRKLLAKHGPLPPRPTTRTGGSGGYALFFRHAGEPLRGRSGVIGPGLDPLRGRQAVMVPPSCHPVTGRPYVWLTAPWDVPPPSIPSWLAQALAPPPERPPPEYPPAPHACHVAVSRAFGIVSQAPSGGANDALNRASYNLGRWVGAGLLDHAEALCTLQAAAHYRRIPTAEANATIKSGLTAGMRNPKR